MSRLMNRAALAAALSLTALLAATALEAKEGLVRVVVNESTARVSVYRLVDVAKGRYESFLFDQDPRTSFATLSLDGRQVRLGDSADFRTTVTRTATGILIEFRSAACVVRESVDFARSAGAALADGVKLGFSLENVGQKESSLGLRLLLDTWLAEKSGIHFRTAASDRVVEEASFKADSGVTWIGSPGDQANLMIDLGGEGRPQSVVLANWKRLNDEPWALDTSQARGFTLMPYSVNDSAAALYWEPAAVARGGTREVAVWIGQWNEKGWSAVSAAESASASTATEALFAQTALQAGNADPAAALGADLVALRDLIGRIDRALAAGTQTADEIAAWKKILDLLEERKKGY